MRQFTVLTTAAGALLLVAGCGAQHRSASTGQAAEAAQPKPALGGPAPASLTGRFTTTLGRRDAASAPRPSEMPIGPWTLVIANDGGPGGTPAVGVGDADNNRTVYRFGVTGNRLSLRCTDDNGLPASGSETYSWAISGGKLDLKLVSAPCRTGDLNNQVILSSHPWTRTEEVVARAK